MHALKPGSHMTSNFKETASTSAASFDVDADVDAGIGFISIVDVDVGVNIVNQALVLSDSSAVDILTITSSLARMVSGWSGHLIFYISIFMF